MQTEQLRKQLVRAILDELDLRVAGHLTDPSALSALSLVKRMLPSLASATSLAVASNVTGVLDARAAMRHEVSLLEEAEQVEIAMLAPPGGTTSRFLTVTAETMQVYLRGKLSGVENAKVETLVASQGGYSKDIFIVGLSNAGSLDKIVIRCDIDGGPVETSTVDELQVLNIMHRNNVPVAEPLWADKDSPFGGLLAMAFKPGRPAFDSVGATASSDSSAAALSLARILAQAHRVPIAQLIDEDSPQASVTIRTSVLRMIEATEAQWHRRRMWPSEILSTAFTWLKDNLPASDQPATVVHGDASLRNLLCSDSHGNCLLDWEHWHLGDPCEDLVYARSDVDKVIPWEIFLEEYHSHGGPARYTEEANHYFSVWGLLRNAVLSECCAYVFAQAQRPQTRMIYAGLVLHRSLVRDLAARLDILLS